MLDRGPKLWAVILAGGDGTCFTPLARALCGSGARSMLQAAVDRLALLVPLERIVVVVHRNHEDLARHQLAEPDREAVILCQPRDLDTGPGVLLPLAWIRARDRAARVVVLPADHHVAQPDALLSAIEHAQAACQLDRQTIALLGAEPDRPATEYGWIVPGGRLPHFGMRSVQRFFEKPGPELAAELLRLGALWNTSIMIGAAEALWQLGHRHMPQHAHCIAGCALPQELEDAYAALPAVNFSRGVLERASDLAMLPLRGAGWACLSVSAPRRIGELDETADLRLLLAQMAQSRGGRAQA